MVTKVTPEQCIMIRRIYLGTRGTTKTAHSNCESEVGRLCTPYHNPQQPGG